MKLGSREVYPFEAFEELERRVPLEGLLDRTAMLYSKPHPQDEFLCLCHH